MKIKKIIIIFLILIFIVPITAQMQGFNYAEKLFKDGFYEMAVEEYKNFISNNSQDRRIEKAYYKLFLSYFRMKKYKKIIYESPNFIQKYNESHYIGDVYYLLAYSYYKNNNLNRAKILLKRIKNYNKESSFYFDALFLLTKINKKENNLKKYKNNLEYIIKLNPEKSKLKKIYKELVTYYYKENNFKKSKEYLKKIKPEELENGEWLWLWSDISYHQKNYKNALINLNKILKRFPDTKYYYYSLKRIGDIKYKQKNYVDADKYYKKSLNANPNSDVADDALKKQIDIYKIMGEQAKAVKKIKYFIKTYPKSEHNEYLLDYIIKYYKRKNNIKELLHYYSIYEDIIGSEEKLVTLYMDKIDYLEKKQEYKKAINEMIDFVRNNQNSKMRTYFKFKIGKIYGNKLKNYDKAIITLTQLIGDKDYGDKSLFNIGLYYEKQNQQQKAIKKYKQILDNYKYSAFFSKAKNRIKYLKKYIMTDKDKAIDMFDKLVDKIKNSNNIDVLKEKGDIYYYLKDFDKAYNYYKNSSEESDKYYKSYVYMNLLNRSNKSKIKSFIQKNTNKQNINLLKSLYEDTLIFYEITNDVSDSDYEYYFNNFENNINNDVFLSYINYLLKNNKKEKLLNITKYSGIDKNLLIYLEGLKYYYKNNYGKASSSFKKIENSDFKQKEYIYYFIADILYSTDKLSESKKYLLKIKNSLELKIQASVLLSKIYYQKEFYQDVIYNIYNVLQRDSSYYHNYDVMKIYLNSLLKQNQTNMVRLTLNKINSKNDKLSTLKGIKYIEIGNKQKGEKILKSVKSFEAKKILYKYYSKNNSWNNVIEYFNDNDSYSVSRLIIANLKNNKYNRAKSLYDTYENKLSDYKNEIDYYFGEYFYKNKKQYKTAKKYINAVISRKESKWHDDSKYMLGNIHLSQKKYDKSLNILKEIIKQYPASDLKHKVYMSIGQLYYSRGEFEKAIPNFIKSEKLKSDRNIFYNIGLAYKKIKKYKKAKQYFNKIISKNKIDKLYYNAYINYVYILMDQSNYTESIDMLNKLMEKASLKYHIEIQFNIGDCYFAKKEYKKAIREYLKVKYFYNSKDNNNFQWLVTSLFKAGKSYEILNKFEKAIELYEYIAEISPESTSYYKTAKNKIKQISNY